MIFRDKIISKLQAKRERFREFDDDFHREAEDYAQALQELSGLSSEELTRRVTQIATPGALPTSEFDRARELRVAFGKSFGNHEESRDWACQTLLDHTTFAADGSQILPVKDFSIPVAAIQVAWFENCHTRDGQYTKDAEFEVLAPNELFVEYDGERVISEQTVYLRRFELEVITLCRLMKRVAENSNAKSKMPLALFDNSLVISFADRLQQDFRTSYINLVLDLLRCSEETGVPVVGYVDTSYARDLTNLLAHCFGLSESEKIHDAQLVNHLLQWGDRTPLFICARGSADKKQQGVLESFQEYRRAIGFTYLKTNSSAPPARLDIPLWVYEKGLLDEVIDLVRAEVIVGNGYPYVIETADAAAVITARDREGFYSIFRWFAAEEGVDLRVSQKSVSKTRRR